MGEFAVAITAIAVVLIERVFSSREGKKQREHELSKERTDRRRVMYLGWLNLTGGIAPLMLEYIAAVPHTSFLKTEWNRRMQELEQALALDAPTEVVLLATAHRVAIGNAAPAAFKEAGAVPAGPGREFSLIFSTSLQRMTSTERLALLNAMRADLGNEPNVGMW